MRVVVTGLVATYPVGGVAWDYLQYVQGFRALGCEVTYLEDTGQWLYDPAAQTFTDDVRANARYLNDALASLDTALARCWSLRAPDGTSHGLDDAAVGRACAAADLFLTLSGSCWLRDAYRAARVKAYVDTDPGYSQAKIAAVEAGVADDSVRFSVNLIRQHDVFFTLGEGIGRPGCPIPTRGLTWHPTRPPIVLANWPVRSPPHRPFTTVMSWKIEPTPPSLGGRVYGGKDVEFERFMDLPSRTPERLEVAHAGEAPRARLRGAGRRVPPTSGITGAMSTPPHAHTAPRGEYSIAKNAYVALRSGWFSTRTAAYLACGKPAVVQETGWSAPVPPGPGLHAFTTAEERVAALAALPPRYPRPPPHPP